MSTTDGYSPRITRTNASLLAALERIDGEGWDGETAIELLRFVRERVARPISIDVGLRGLAASQAEATAWQAAWIAMTKPAVRRAGSPWGVVWRAAKRAALGEVVAAQYGKTERRAWELRRPCDGSAPARLPLSLDALLESGWEPRTDEIADTDLHDLLETARRALEGVGWEARDADRIVRAVVDLPTGREPGVGTPGWRRMARDLEIPPWQARRLCVALCGTPTWRGLLARVLTEGTSAVGSPAMRAALRATRVRRHRSPVLAAQRSGSGPEDPQVRGG